MQKWQADGLFGDNNLAYDANGELAKLENKEAAIIFSGSWNIATINEFSNKDDIVCKGFPYFEEKPLLVPSKSALPFHQGLEVCDFSDGNS